MDSHIQKEWSLNIRPYDPSKAPEHYPNTDEWGAFVVESKDISKHQGVLKFIAKMTKKLINSGFNLLNLTLPAALLTDMSSAEAILHGYGRVSLFAQEAAKSDDPIYRLKLIQAGLVSNLCVIATIIEGNPPYCAMLGGTLQVSNKYGRMIECNFNNRLLMLMG